jgi:hypothetical protein
MDEARDRHVFVVKVWRHALACDGWRASVLHVASGKRLATVHLRDVADFISLRLQDGRADGSDAD